MTENPVVELPRAMVSKINFSEKNGRHYLTIEDGQNTFSFSGGDIPGIENTPTLVPMKMTLEIGGFIYDRKQVLTLKKFKGVPL